MTETSPPPGAAPCLETRQRLLTAASAVFAEVGYYHATVREICSRAGANVAAVNYHFGDKEQLYLAVLRHGARLADEKYPIVHPASGGPAPDGGAAPTPEQRLRSFIHTFMMRIFDCERVATHGRLMAREIIEPTPALDILVEEIIRPIADLLRQLVRDVLGAGASEQDVLYCASSVISQCVYYNHCRPMMIRLYPQQTYEPAEIERLAEHISRFSLSALHVFAKELS